MAPRINLRRIHMRRSMTRAASERGTGQAIHDLERVLGNLDKSEPTSNFFSTTTVDIKRYRLVDQLTRGKLSRFEVGQDRHGDQTTHTSKVGGRPWNRSICATLTASQEDQYPSSIHGDCTLSKYSSSFWGICGS